MSLFPKKWSIPLTSSTFVAVIYITYKPFFKAQKEIDQGQNSQ